MGLRGVRKDLLTRMEKLGILGGMGPAATARLLTRIVDLTDVACDQDHIDVTVLNRPSVPDRTAYLLGKEGAPSFVPALVDMAQTLEALGCTVLATPCNTAHARENEVIASLSQARMVDMPREAASFLRGLGCSKVGVLATDGTLAAGVYQRACLEAGLCMVVPDADAQVGVMRVIYDGVKAGREVPECALHAMLDSLVGEGCDGIVLGCTELSVLPFPARYKGSFVADALDVLAWRCVEECGAKARDLRARFA